MQALRHKIGERGRCETMKVRKFGEKATVLVLFCCLTAVLLTGYLAATIYDALEDSVRIAPMRRILAALLVCASAYVGALLGTARGSISRARWMRGVLWLCFALYLHLILNFTLFDAGLGRQAHGGVPIDRASYMEWFVNFRPFHTIKQIYIDGYRYHYIGLRYLLLNLAGNIVAFMPFAFFLPRLFPRTARWWKFLLLIVSTVCLVEAAQLLFMCGSCDVDDLILNAGGAMGMYGLLAIPPVRRFLDRMWCMGKPTEAEKTED